MISQIALAGLLTLSAVVLTAGPVRAHSGGLDSYGCHHDRKHGGYHCHRGPLAGQSYVSQQEMLNAMEALNQEPNDHPDWLQPPDLADPSKKAPAEKAPEAYTILRTSL
jgi:hypothetical protein